MHERTQLDSSDVAGVSGVEGVAPFPLTLIKPAVKRLVCSAANLGFNCQLLRVRDELLGSLSALWCLVGRHGARGTTMRVARAYLRASRSWKFRGGPEKLTGEKKF